jgi:hypothetical protein
MEKLNEIRNSDNYKKVIALRVEETTTPKQEKNGTLKFHDAETGLDYMVYATGYARRGYFFKGKNGRNYGAYQLNNVKYISATAGREKTERILHVGDYDTLLEIIARAITNYRKNKS